MADFASVSGIRVVSGSISIPLYGMWSGDVLLATDTDVVTNTNLVIGNLTMACNIYRQSPFAGSRRCRIVAGFGGWRLPVAKKQYSFANGIKLSTILKDAAMEVGEQVNIPNDRIVGSGYVREQARASRVLRQLAGTNWYTDKNGVVQVAAWPTVRVNSDFQVIDQDGGSGVVTIATEDYASWMPGCTFTGSVLNGTFTNGGVLFELNQTVRLQVMTQP